MGFGLDDRFLQVSLKAIKAKLISSIEWVLQFTNFNLIPKNRVADIRNTLNLFRPYESEFQLVRIGSASDGGYLLPDDLEGVEKCISPGCDLKVEFETQLWDQFHIPSLILDSINQLPKEKIQGLTFLPKWLSPVSKDGYLTLEEAIDAESHSLILQMDIEGGEYLNLALTPHQILSKFRIIVIEFHDLSKSVASFEFLSMLDTVLKKLLQSHYVVHFHENTTSTLFKVGHETFPTVIEITLHKRDRVKSLEESKSIRHNLDSPNSNDAVNAEPEFNFKFNYEL